MSKNQSLIFACLFVLTSSCQTNHKKEPSSLLEQQPEVIAISDLPSSTREPSATQLDWSAVTDAQVQAAVCRKNLPQTSDQISKYFLSKDRRGIEPGGRSTILGIEFQDEHPSLLLAFAKLFAPVPNEVPSLKSPEDLQRAFSINPGCRKVLCAAQKVFGSEIGPQMIYLMDAFDINTSPYVFSNASLFRSDEIRDVIKSLELIDTKFLPFEPNKKLIKFRRGFTRALYAEKSGRVLANATIELFDPWSDENSLTRQYTLFHEYGHNFSDNQFSKYDVSESWLRQSQWKTLSIEERKFLREQASQGHPFVSKYSETNPFEDFAESVAAYRLNPALLKKQSLEKYKMLQLLVFDGREYTDLKNCSQPTWLERIQKQALTSTFSAPDTKTVKDACRLTFYQSVLGNYPASFFKDCVNYESTLIWNQANQKAYPDLVPQSLFDSNIKTSLLQFPRIWPPLASELREEAADWILERIDVALGFMGPSAKAGTTEFCNAWTALAERMYPGPDGRTPELIKSKWTMLNPISSTELRPRANAARTMCLEIVQGYVPPTKSTLQEIKLWLMDYAPLTTYEKLSSRGITRDSLIRYMRARF